ncbi:carboxylesterase/lipase family protein [Sphingobium sp. H39-3-25]|uniref:carboxylesterase/lipase family protein n=1 Tax=Sphingobium arseniciresistens TaxID=3030834 RepID=UPI0023B8F2A3|nr:carboxylesterase/lipase family protein [Sphingobium arseniciresistens]
MFNSTRLSRRAILRAAGAGGSAAFTAWLPAWANASTGPVVETTAGKVRGGLANGVMHFLGVPYGGDTGGVNRWMPPPKPTPWAGERDATLFKGMSPQVLPNFEAWPTRDFMNQMSYCAPVEMNENCLTLNVWTRGLADGRKRPVMVWFHGGGFEAMSPNSPLYDGTNSALNGDVVMVTVNHRLNVLGYLWLGDVGGEKYANSGNPGQLDLVASLQWVRDNIERFGGDPSNVTIFGESGGAGKVGTLLAMPGAKGLFHKAIIESGRALVRMVSREDANAYTETYLKILGLPRERLSELHTMPYARLAAAMAPAAATYGASNAHPALWPVVDRHVLPSHPYDPTAPDVSDDVPVMVGSNKDEAALFTAIIPDVWNRTLTDAQLKERVTGAVGAQADKVITAYKAIYPNRSPAELLNIIETARGHWISGITMAERKYAKRHAPVYSYLFTYETPVAGGKLGTPHTMELPFVFDTVAAMDKMTDRSPQALALAKTCNQAWTSFAHTGTPAAKGLPDWPAYDTVNRSTMILGLDSRVVNDPNRAERELWTSLRS